MVTPLSDGGGGGVARAFAPFDAVFVSGLLVVTKFLACSAELLVEGFDAEDGAGVAFDTAAGLAGAALTLAGAGLATGLAGAFTGFAGAAFFTMGLLAIGLAAAFDTGLATAFLTAGLAAFFGTLAAGFFFAGTLRALCAAARATVLPRAGAFAAFALLPGFTLLFAIPKPIL